MNNWGTNEYLQLVGILISSLTALTIYLLQQRLSDKQRVDHRLETEKKVGKKLSDTCYKSHSCKVQLYNSKLLNNKNFSKNKRSIIWGYPYHGAELFAANFDGLEFVVGINLINGKKHYKVGVIPYEHILGIKPKGDGSFSGLIFYVRPRLIQRDKYSIAYGSFRYYPIPKDE